MQVSRNRGTPKNNRWSMFPWGLRWCNWWHVASLAGLISILGECMFLLFSNSNDTKRSLRKAFMHNSSWGHCFLFQTNPWGISTWLLAKIWREPSSPHLRFLLPTGSCHHLSPEITHLRAYRLNMFHPNVSHHASKKKKKQKKMCGWSLSNKVIHQPTHCQTLPWIRLDETKRKQICP